MSGIDDCDGVFNALVVNHKMSDNVHLFHNHTTHNSRDVVHVFHDNVHLCYCMHQNPFNVLYNFKVVGIP